MRDRRKRQANTGQQRDGKARTDHYRHEAGPSETVERKTPAQYHRRQHHSGNREPQGD
jgi:hypothetical protein